MAWRRPGDKPLSEPMMVSLLTHICVARPQWVNDLDTITCPSVSSIGAIAMEFGMDIIVTYGTFSIIYILVTTDVVGDNWCGRFGLWPFQSVAVSVCGRSGLWPFRLVVVSVCGRSGFWPFRFVAVSVCGRFGCGRFGLWPLWPVTKSWMGVFIQIPSEPPVSKTALW